MPELNSTVTVLPSSTAAGVVRQQLEAAGIASAVVEAGGTFQLQVAEEDFPRAMQLLFPIPSAEMAAAILSGQARPWKCADCGEEVQPTSDVCWSCGKPKAPAAAAAAPKVSPPAPPMFPYPEAPAVELPPPPMQPTATTRPVEAAAALEAALDGSESETGEPAPLAAASSRLAAAPQNREANASRSPTAPRESSVRSPSKPAAAAVSLEAAPQKRSVRAPAAEEPNPWKNPWLIGIWVMLGLAICLIAWRALR